jgi:arylsulfatase A-like enzyme
MLIRVFILLAFILLWPISLLSSASAQQNNVLLIIGDDFGLDVASFYPVSSGRPATTSSLPPMPNLTALANKGVLFSDAWAQMECSPTRATIVTGRHAFRTGVGAWIGPGRPAPELPLSEFIIPEAVTAARGTSTYLAHDGKWHLTLPSLRDPNYYGWPNFAGPYVGGALSVYMPYSKVVNGVRRQSNVYATTQ